MHPQDLVKAYKNDENITLFMKKVMELDDNTEEIIETAYDLQAGSYVRFFEIPFYHDRKTSYGIDIAKEILAWTKPASLLEAGIGEGTTFSYVMSAFDDIGVTDIDTHGFDLSWSRIAECKKWLKKQGRSQTYLSVASLFNLPYADNSFDVVYTSQAIEPNRGQEKRILNELWRVASRYIVLSEPAYELVSEDIQQRMDKYGYCRNLKDHAESLGMKIVKYELFETKMSEPENPLGILVIEKNPDAPTAKPQLACPRYGNPLNEYEESLFSPESLRAYPKIQGIPCLRIENGIIASRYEQTED